MTKFMWTAYANNNPMFRFDKLLELKDCIYKKLELKILPFHKKIYSFAPSA